MNRTSKTTTPLYLILVTSIAMSCATTSAHKRQDIVIRDFSGDSAGAEVRSAIESRMGGMKQFRVIARDESSLAVTQQEAVVGQSKDDLFHRPNAGVKLREGLAGAKVLHGTCFRSKDRHTKKVLNGWLFGAYYPGEFVTDNKLYCSYRLINAETHVQEYAGDSDPVEWTSQADDGPPDPDTVRKLASEIVAHLQNQMKGMP